MHRMGRPKLSRMLRVQGGEYQGGPRLWRRKKLLRKAGGGQSGSCESPKAKAALPLTFRLSIA